MLAGDVGRVAAVDAVREADVVVNATPMGMGLDQSLPCDPTMVGRGQVAVDLIYSPATTRWMSEVRSYGAEAHNGLTMLVHQAAVAFRRWTGESAPVDQMKLAAIEALSGQ